MATEQEKNRRVAEQLRLIDDDFLRLYFNDNPEGVEYILNVLLQRQDLKVLHSANIAVYPAVPFRWTSMQKMPMENGTTSKSNERISEQHQSVLDSTAVCWIPNCSKRKNCSAIWRKLL